MNFKKVLYSVIILMVLHVIGFSQTEMADTMRSNGKIYVVVAVLATIFAGLFLYLLMLEKKITRIEKEEK